MATALHSPSLGLHARLAQPADRLGLALFLAAAVHAIVILGVRFAGSADPRTPLPTLEVLLLPDGPAAMDENQDAAYLAQRAQRGSGTTRAPMRASLPESSASLLEQEGDPQGETVMPVPAEHMPGSEPIVARRAERAAITLVPGAGEDAQQSVTPRASRPMPQIGVNAQAADEKLRLRGPASTDDRLLADTRASQIAEYSDAWRRRIERAGTLNFPLEAQRSRLRANPVLEVVVSADGQLRAVVVRRSSGDPALDQAAVQIVRMAAPFDRFPPGMRAEYLEWRFAYEWQFMDGAVGRGSVYSDAPP